MQNTYIVVLKTVKKPQISLKRRKKSRKQPIIAINQADCAFFSNFSRVFIINLGLSQKEAFFAKSGVEIFEICLIRDRVKSSFNLVWASQLSPEKKKPLTIARAAVLNL